MAEEPIVFVSRDAIAHELGGSTTAAINLLSVLRDHGSKISVIVTLAHGRSPRLFFKYKVPLPEGVTYLVPGYLRIGTWYINCFSPRAWARAMCRAAARIRLLKPLSEDLLLLFRGNLVPDAWDLSTPTKAEIACALGYLRKLDPPTVIVNYAIWAPLLAAPEFGDRKRVILMHDMLSARITKFLRSGFPLDCPMIGEKTELNWLNQADYVLAIQKTEAEFVTSRLNQDTAPHRQTEVLVQPIVLSIHTSTRKPNPFRCLFVGTNIRPNTSGIRWFLESVWPIVIEGNPRAALVIAGTVCNTIEGEHPNVRLLGVVPSLTDEIDIAGVCIIPLQVGSGLKIKLLEALAAGKACVSTPIGVQGIEDWAQAAIDVASEPADFAAAILRLMFDDNLRVSREQAAHELVRRHFSPDSAAAQEFAAQVLGGAGNRERGAGNRE